LNQPVVRVTLPPMTSRTFPSLLAFALVSTSLVGCGGTVDETHEGVLEEGDARQSTDDSLQDPYTFKTNEGYAIDIVMESSEVDAYLMLSDPDGNKVGENNDEVPGNNNARIQMVAPSSGTYTVFANTFRPGEAGSYTLTIHATEPAAAE
jgi:hypothetical protein